MTDSLATHAAEQMIFDLVSPRPTGQGGQPSLTDPQAIADAVVGMFDVRWDFYGNLRRLVLTGPWEVDPQASGR